MRERERKIEKERDRKREREYSEYLIRIQSVCWREDESQNKCAGESVYVVKVCVRERERDRGREGERERENVMHKTPIQNL
jgi:hypothetical protein